eukprot:ANDGO_02762.mRNA.1 hypothetical protein EMIHUDRAFT_445288
MKKPPPDVPSVVIMNDTGVVSQGGADHPSYAPASSIEKLKSNDELNKDKHNMHEFIGFLMLFLLSITIPVTIVSVISHRSLWLTYNANIFWTIPTGIGVTLCIWYLTSKFRIWLLRRNNFTEEEIRSIVQHRNKEFPLAEMRSRHTSHCLRVCDGIPRKLNHVFTTFFNLFFVSFAITDNSVRIQTAIVGQVLNIIVSALVYRSDGWIASSPFFGSSSRIRDGRWGRLNLMIVRVVGLTALLMVTSIFSFLQDDVDKTRQSLVIVYAYIPTACGDAAGEVIGSLFGKIEFKVWGIGEVNRKTVEGTTAVFLFSIVPMLIVSCIYEVDDFTIYRFWLILIMSVVSTVLEVISPRGTDNWTLPTANAAIAYLWVSQGNPI